jgi:flavin-dependent dehydrogenase
MWPTIAVETGDQADSVDWRVIASRGALTDVSRYAFGSRIASTNLIKLDEKSSSESCWVESVKDGWLFLIPCGGGRGSLISVGGSADVLLAESRLVATQIDELGIATGRFPAYPQIALPLGGSGWIACGTAAVAFDPIAGEGAGNALREGILASAVIRAAAAEGACVGDLLAHYSNRLLSGFLRHVQECRRFYTTVGGPWWEAEAEWMRQGAEWAQNALSSQPRSFFQLIGFELQRCS